MDRSNFLKKLMAGAAMPVMLAGCSAEDNSDTGILEPGEDAAAKSAGYEYNNNDFELCIKINGIDYYLTLERSWDDTHYYSGFWKSKSDGNFNVSLVYLKAKNEIVLTEWHSNNRLSTYALKYQGKKQFSGHNLYIAGDAKNPYFIGGTFGKITKGSLPGITD